MQMLIVESQASVPRNGPTQENWQVTNSVSDREAEREEITPESSD